MTPVLPARFFSKNLLTVRNESAIRASEPENSHKAVTRPCRRIDAGFPLPSIYRRRESGHSNARGCPYAVFSSRHPRPESLRLACVDANKEAKMGGVAGAGVRKRQACRGVRPRDVLDIGARKIAVPAWHVRQDTAYFSSLHPKNLLTSRSESAIKASEPTTSQSAVTRLCRRIDAGFSLPSVYRRRESGHSNARGCPFAVCSSRHPRPTSLRLACVDAKTEAKMGGVAGAGVRKRQACRGVRSCWA